VVELKSQQTVVAVGTQVSQTVVVDLKSNKRQWP
jgi:hypothetical protein